MKHTEVFTIFKKYLPIYADKVIEWFPNGLNSIRIRLDSKEEFIFSLDGDGGFRFETIDSFINKLRGGSAMKC